MECCQPIPPSTKPFAVCCMVCPPPCLAPTQPAPVKPLRLPCPTDDAQVPQMSEEDAERSRYANFYNNYNIDWHQESSVQRSSYPDPRKPGKCKGVTTDGKNPCDGAKKWDKVTYDNSCPTGFKLCAMKLSPPPGCHPCGVWNAEIQPCPPKPKKKVSNYQSGNCTRPCCKHWKPKDGDCKYDDPCKAHCFNHPPGMKPKRQRT